MTDELVNIPDKFQPKDTIIDDKVPAVLNFEGIGEIMVSHGNATTALAVAMCLLNNPNVNKYFLASNLKLDDRLTGTRIFPREGMSLPEGETFNEKEEA